MFDVGRVCMKTAGREAGRYCVVLKKSEGGFLLITGPRNLTKVKRRKCNINHLEPLVDRLKIKAEASDEEVLKAYKEEKLMDKLGLKEIKTEHHKAVHKEKAEPKKEEHKKTEHKKEAPKEKKAGHGKEKPKEKTEHKKGTKPATKKEHVKSEKEGHGK